MNIFRKRTEEKMNYEEKVDNEAAKFKSNLSDFSLKVTLGTGTFGRVRLVQHKDTEQYFALKMLKKREVIRLKQVAHILSECSILSSISHAVIVNLVSCFQDDTRLYMVLEYVSGGEMFSHLRRMSTFPDEVARLYTAEIVGAFEYLHERQIAYRDLKPENLLITNAGHIKIADFGFAKVIKDCTWTLCGTPEYLAPEIVKSKGHGVGVDWWALGILMFEMHAGYPPFFDENVFGIYKKILQGNVAFPSTFNPKAKDLVKRLLNQDLTKRIGCLRNGPEDIKQHKWFSKMDWSDVNALRIKPTFIPKVAGPGDASNFDRYPESMERTAPLPKGENELFKTFGNECFA